MAERGEKHARDGRELTPFDCQSLDRELFAAMKVHARPAKWYATMRGAFNRAWEHEQFRISELASKG